jgi:hypothetical protein
MRSVVLAILLLGSSNQAFAQRPPGSSGMQEGVTVHGDWVIDVRNPDGTLAHRHAFKNALVGGSMLAAILSRGAVPGQWQVLLRGDACADDNKCVVNETTGLTVGLSASGAALILAGTLTATSAQASQLTSVGTDLSLCAPTDVASYACPPTLISVFSQVALAAPIPITAGQMATVTVTFTFS